MKANFLKFRYLTSVVFLIFIFISVTAAGIAQKVKITNVDGPIKYSCGGYYWRVKFDLDQPAPAKGIIVQQIHILLM